MSFLIARVGFSTDPQHTNKWLKNPDPLVSKQGVLWNLCRQAVFNQRPQLSVWEDWNSSRTISWNRSWNYLQEFFNLSTHPQRSQGLVFCFLAQRGPAANCCCPMVKGTVQSMFVWQGLDKGSFSRVVGTAHRTSMHQLVLLSILGSLVSARPFWGPKNWPVGFLAAEVCLHHREFLEGSAARHFWANVGEPRWAASQVTIPSEPRLFWPVDSANRTQDNLDPQILTSKSGCVRTTSLEMWRSWAAEMSELVQPVG